MGITFKENCPDIRNSKVIDIIKEFKDYDLNVDVYDPIADKIEFKNNTGIKLIKDYSLKKYDAVVFTVAHSKFKSIDLKNQFDPSTIIFDTKGFLNRKYITSRL